VHVFALIPARGGSTGIPRKNLTLLGGRPMIEWTVDAALESARVGSTVVSTDDGQIAAVAERRGLRVIRRPPELAADDTPMRDVVRHACEELDADVLVLLQPTSPLRRAEHVDAAVDLLLATDADAVVSVVEVPHRFGPASLMSLDGDRLVRLGEITYGTRQEKPTLYARNGPAILALRPSRMHDDLYAGDLRAYVMQPGDSVDIDEPFDLELAEFLLARR
jgi:CMP-N-acetylneuraminic acid synthetase